MALVMTAAKQPLGKGPMFADILRLHESIEGFTGSFYQRARYKNKRKRRIRDEMKRRNAFIEAYVTKLKGSNEQASWSFLRRYCS